MKLERLENIAEIIAGQSPPSNTYNQNQDGLPFFQGKADFGEMFPKVRYWCKVPTKIALPNDILMSVRAPVGPVNICNVESCIGRGLSAIRINKKYTTDYIYYFLKANERQIAKLGVGSTFTAITQKEIRELLIRIPENPDDQIRITKLLSKSEALIKKRKESIALFEDFLRSTFLKMFGDPVNNEMNWEQVPLSVLGSLDRGVSKNRPRNAPELLGGKYPLIQTGEVSNAGLYITKYKHTYSEVGLKQSKLWNTGTMLITIAANIAQTSILTFDACFPDSIVGFVANEKEANTIYVHFLFSFFQKILEANAPHAAQKNINLALLRNLPVPKPSIELQNKFAVLVSKVELLKDECENNLIDLENLFGSLNQKAFKGELNFSSPDIVNTVLHTEDSEIKKPPIDLEKGDEVSLSEEQKIKTGIFLGYDTELPKAKQVEIKKKKGKKPKLNWEKISTQQAANWIKENYMGYHFTTEMLIRFLMDEHITFPDYYSSEELKKNPQANEADDLKTLIFSAVSKENPFLKLDQVFYNGIEENIELKITEVDYQFIKDLSPKDRSGIYFSIIE